jgi:hypothetical protein
LQFHQGNHLIRVESEFMLSGQSFWIFSHNCFYYTSKPECTIPDDNWDLQQ